ncbi:MAG: hypothetical protein LBB41_06310 [Prevotellaceae bacterium]|jgi:hypothetical protein|nr:hypothetical protein [Prevotellaceae bacterium]
MAKNSEIEKQSDELLKLILRKTGLSYNDLIDLSKRNYILANIDVVSPAERKQFSKLVLQ